MRGMQDAKVQPALDQTSTRASLPFGSLESAFFTSAAVCFVVLGVGA